MFGRGFSDARPSAVGTKVSGLWFIRGGGWKPPRIVSVDTFSTDRAIGSVNGTAAEPGPGTRSLLDSGNRVSISGGDLLVATGGASSDPRLTYGGVTAVAGLLVCAEVRLNENNSENIVLRVGWDAAASGAVDAESFEFTASAVINARWGSSSVQNIGTAYSRLTNYKLADCETEYTITSSIGLQTQITIDWDILPVVAYGGMLPLDNRFSRGIIFGNPANYDLTVGEGTGTSPTTPTTSGPLVYSWEYHGHWSAMLSTEDGHSRNSFIEDRSTDGNKMYTSEVGTDLGVNVRQFKNKYQIKWFDNSDKLFLGI